MVVVLAGTGSIYWYVLIPGMCLVPDSARMRAGFSILGWFTTQEKGTTFRAYCVVSLKA